MGAVASGGPQPGEGAAAEPESILVRRLEEGVKILSFTGGREVDDLHYVSYYPNGMCEAYEVKIGDAEGRTARIRVDRVTGKAKVTNE